MDPIAVLRARLEAVTTEFRSIHDTAGEAKLDEAQEARWAELDAEETEVRAEIEKLEVAEVRAAKIAEQRAKFQSVQIGAPVPSDDVDVRSLSRPDAQSRALKRSEETSKMLGLRADQESKIERLLRASSGNISGDFLARRLLLTETDAYRSAYMKGMTSASPAFTPEEARALAAFRALEERAMNEGTGSAGGFGVPVLIDPTIILTAQGSLNPFRAIARVETITNNEWKGVSSAGVSWSYDAEATAVSDDSPTLTNPSVPVHMARGFVPYSIELGQDYPGFALEISPLLAMGYDELQAESFATGTGVGQPTGILTALDANPASEVAVITNDALVAADISKVWNALPDRWKQAATWVMSQAVGTDIAGWGDAYGTRTVDATGTLEKLRERPIAYSSYFPQFAGTASQNILAVGDFRNFLIAERAGMTTEFVPHLFDTTTGRPTGERGWFAFARHGSDSINDAGFRLLKNQATADV
ncbi:phage major capsid protein, HK97 family [Promicromonospora umidemergens]|nr:phage major capsid protein [Promicromonospora umidemergens]MCP2284874.1 phage major capsid protein, HK97 family [Promicromonospora umidemergens]